MVTYGYIISSKPNDVGGTDIQVRVPSVHGAFDLSEYKGRTPKNRVADDDLPWYPALESVSNPTKGAVAVLLSVNDAHSGFIVIGTTGSMKAATEVYD